LDSCAELFVLVVGGGTVVVLIVGFLAYSSLKRRLDAQAKRIADLEANVPAATVRPEDVPGAATTDTAGRPAPVPTPAAGPAAAAPAGVQNAALGAPAPDRPSAQGRPAPPPAGDPEREPPRPAVTQRPDVDETAPPAVTPPPVEPVAPAEPAAPAPSPEPEAPPPLPPPRTIDWERWIGVRGAAVLGGIVLSLAGLLFLQYTIEAGWITPEVRVVIALAAGLAALGVAPFQRRRGYPAVSEALAGAGVVLLYGGLWAGHVLYDLFGAGPTFAGVVAVTGTCGWIAWRHGSRIVAILGLLGGFAAPLILSLRVQDPAGLFGYLLLLNVGLWLVARRRGWGELVLAAVVATAAYEAWWVEAWLPRYDLGWPLVILAGFGLLYALTGELERRRGGGASWTAAQLVGVALPVLLGFRLALGLGDGVDLWRLAVYLGVLSFAGDRLAAARGLPRFGAALAALGVGVLSASAGVEAGAWARVGASALLAAVFHAGFELDLRLGRPGDPGWEPAAVAALGHLALLVAIPAIGATEVLAPWLCGWLLLAALLARQAVGPGREWRTPAAAGLVGFGLAATFVETRWAAVPAAALALGGLAVALVRLRRSEAGRRGAWLAAAIVAAFALLGLWAEATAPALEPWVFLVAGFGLAVVVATAATALESVPLYALAAGLLVFAQWAWGVVQAAVEAAPGLSDLPVLLALLAIPATAFTLWPSLEMPGGRRLRPPESALRIAAAAAPAWVLPIVVLWRDGYGGRYDGIPAAALAAVSALGLVAALRHANGDHRDGEPATRAARSWFPAFGIGLLALAVALQLEREWLTIGWAALAVALLAAWRRVGWTALWTWALVLFAGVAVRLLLNPAVVRYHEIAGPPAVNWLATAYLVPAAAFLAGRHLLAGADRGPSRPAAAACGVGAVLLVFWWLNLAVVAMFSAGPGLDLSLGHRPARDLTLSAAWILYALCLLGLGLTRKSPALRWLSLAFLVLAIVKVFLYDLGELRDLWRVASLVGLALSLLAVSLAYQRFVFGPEKGGTRATESRKEAG